MCEGQSGVLKETGDIGSGQTRRKGGRRRKGWEKEGDDDQNDSI